jgi:hypothetical protein
MKPFHVKKKSGMSEDFSSQLSNTDFFVHSQYGISLFIYLFLGVMWLNTGTCTSTTRPLTFESVSMIFSAILVTFQVGSPILPMAASDYNPSADASHVAGIISRYHHIE